MKLITDYKLTHKDKIGYLEQTIAHAENTKALFIEEQAHLRNGRTKYYRYEEWKKKKDSWVEQTITSLGLLFDSPMYASKFRTAGMKPRVIEWDSDLSGFDDLVREINKKTKVLYTFLDELKSQKPSQKPHAVNKVTNKGWNFGQLGNKNINIKRGGVNLLSEILSTLGKIILGK